MSALISVIHATRGRPKKALETAQLWHDRAKNLGLVEYVFSMDRDDGDYYELSRKVTNIGTKFRDIITVYGNHHGSAAAWNSGANRCSGLLLIQGQDDVEPPEQWDEKLLARLPDGWGGKYIFVAVGDGYRNDELCCTAIMTRKRMEQEGHFIYPGYQSVFSDDEVTYRALRDARAGECQFIPARDLIFKHRHHYHDKTVPWDETYARENSKEAYELGRKLFFERNPMAASDGIRSWA